MTSDPSTFPGLMTCEEVARMLRIDETTLKRWRMENRGPRWIKMGDSQNSPVRYSPDEVAGYLSSRTEGGDQP